MEQHKACVNCADTTALQEDARFWVLTNGAGGIAEGGTEIVDHDFEADSHENWCDVCGEAVRVFYLTRAFSAAGIDGLDPAREGWRSMSDLQRVAFLEYIEAEHGVTDGAYLPPGWALTDPAGATTTREPRSAVHRLPQFGCVVWTDGGTLLSCEMRDWDSMGKHPTVSRADEKGLSVEVTSPEEQTFLDACNAVLGTEFQLSQFAGR